MNRYLGLFFLILFLIPLKAFASWQDHENAPPLPATEHIRPKHVYALASLLAEEIESVRYLMGITKINDSLLQVVDAEPREVYFQAVNLYGKINRLHHNLTARSLADHDLPAIQQNIRPADVWGVLAVTLDQLDEIKDEYGISTHSPFPDLREKILPTDVYQSLLVTIRQTNQMLEERPYTHSDVYQEISTALYCTLNIYNSFPGMPIQKQPVLQPGKTATDVFIELIYTYQTIRNIMRASGLKTLELSATPSPNIKPGDVYDLAVLITSELKFLHSKVASQKTLHDAAYPGIQFPSHVFQRLTYLHKHLHVIQEKMLKPPHRTWEQQP
ncbi:MAG: hypothetical protein Q3M24_02560 [Candidatus Electrothrix aestuarii]|uniref:Imelysin n=1 Tax=Candidatus Electrothrix aestuarii TaxID=3062594 RepID=A0AAU8LWR0_9BACT|nr:hypothetical protein [Candidatus Electrothrix aestuarii]